MNVNLDDFGVMGARRDAALTALRSIIASRYNGGSTYRPASCRLDLHAPGSLDVAEVLDDFLERVQRL